MSETNIKGSENPQKGDIMTKSYQNGYGHEINYSLLHPISYMISSHTPEYPRKSACILTNNRSAS